MTNKTMIAKAVKYALYSGVAASMAVAAPASFAAEEEADEPETVVVTGSRIRSVDIEGANPVQVITREDIERTGLQSVGDILQNIPAAGSAINTTFNNGGDGSTTIDLRNLGSNRVLVLVNGRRWSPGLGGSVDLNNIPLSVIERIDVLKDGASAVYGSDAISGVVNVITRTDYEGMHADAYWGEYDEGDGETQHFAVGMGASGDRGSAYLNVSYTKQEPVLAGDRPISAIPVFGTSPTYGGSSGAPQGRFLFYYPGFTGYEDLTRDGVNGPFVPFGTTDSTPFNFAPFNYLLTPQERTNLYAQGSYEISDNTRFRAEVFYGNRLSEQALAPTPLFVGLFASGLGTETVIGANNPYNPFGFALDATCSDPAAGCMLFVGRRMMEAGFRSFNQDVDQWQFSGGLEGEFEAADRFFNWDFNYTYAKIDERDITTGLLNMQRVNYALSDDCVNDASCVPFNIFDGASATEFGPQNGTINQAMLDYVTFVAQDAFQTKTNDYTFNLSGDMFEMPGGMAKFAFGLEKRFEEGFDQPDALIAAGITSGNARQPTLGAYSVEEAYVEFDLPLLSDVAAAKMLSLQLATRYSDYDTFGDTTNSKIGLKWQPFDDLLIRGTYSEGFRAPSIVEMFQGQSDSFPSLSDPCSNYTTNPDPNIVANCQADGVPAGYVQPNPQIRITVGGNPDLGPEETESNTVGFVYNPSYVENLTVSLDWYQIDITGAVGTTGAQNILNECYTRAPGDRALCEFIDRGSLGQVDDLFNGRLNLDVLSTEGSDLNVRYAFDTDYGKFKINWDTSYVHENGQEFTDSTGATSFENFAGRAGDRIVLPRIRSNMFVDWTLGDWDVSWSSRYIHATVENCDLGTSATDNAFEDQLCSMINDPADPADNENRLGGTTYHDLRVSYALADWDTRVSVGINNVGDKQPPVSYSTFANSFDPTMYDVPGRFYYLSVNKNF